MPLIIPSNSISAGGYEVANSLRFDDGSSDYLNRTFGSGNQQIFTYSTWVKFSNFPTSDSNTLFGNQGGYPNYFFYQKSTQQFRAGAQDSGTNIIYELITNQVFRDLSAWYNIILSVDTTQSTASNRVKLYVNGEQITSFSTETYPSQNANISIGSSGSNFRIGQFSGVWYLNGYLAETVFIDGQQLDPTSFGEFDEDSEYGNQ